MSDAVVGGPEVVLPCPFCGEAPELIGSGEGQQLIMSASEHSNESKGATMNATVKLVAEFEVVEVRLSTTDYAVVRLEAAVPEGCDEWPEAEWDEWNAEHSQFDPQGDGIVLKLNTDDVRPGDRVTLTLEIER